MLELNVWMSTEVRHVERDDVKDEWVVTIRKADGTERVMRPKYVVLGTGFGDPAVPCIPGAVSTFDHTSAQVPPPFFERS